MNEVKPYHSTFPRYGQRVIINIGEPVDLKPHLDAWTALQVKLAAYDNDFKTDKDRNTFDDEDDDDDDDVVVARRLKHLHELREVIALRIAITRTIRESVDRLRLEVADFKRGERKVSE